MEITELQGSKFERKFKVFVPMAALALEIDAKAAELAKTANIDGFRVGKVPLDVIKNKYKDSLADEVINKNINNTVAKLIKEHDLQIIGQPRAESLDFDATKGLDYVIILELQPTVPAVDPKKYSLTKIICEISDKDVDKVLENLQKSRHSLEDLGEAAAKMGDVITMDFTGYMDGKEFDGGAAKDAKLELGSKRFIEGFESGLVGAKAGDKKKLKLKFPKDYHAKDFADKKVEFEVDVKAVAKMKLPELNDEFAAHFSASSLEDLKSKIKQELSKSHDSLAFNLVKKELLDILDKKINFDLPETMVENELSGLIKQIFGDKVVEDAQKEKYREIAKRRVKLGFVLSDIAKQNKLEITQEDVSNAVINYARSMPGREQQVVDYFSQNPQAVEMFKGAIIENKASNYMIDNAKLTEKKVSIDELLELVKKNEEESSAGLID